ncbi:MAG: glycosyltransferase family 2 protein [Clostridia bacterium]|nr:glycosyltransferase family 2 protein [Clostridia bacterium]
MFYSIVIPVYNGKETLGETVKSIVRQDFTDYELILVDDGSTDGTGELCDQFEKQYDFIKVIHQKNAYLGAARNRGLDEASGKYVYFLDADDLLCEGILQAAFFFDGADVIASNRFYAYDCRVGKERVKKGDFDGGMPAKRINSRLAAFSPYAGQSFYRIAFLREEGIRFEEERINSEDRVWTVRLLHRSRKTAVLETPCYRYTEHRAGSLMNCMSADNILGSLQALEALLFDLPSFDYEEGALRKRICNEFLSFCALAALVRDEALSKELMAYVREHLYILKDKDCSARLFLWARHVIGLKNLLKLCNAVFLHYTTDK